MLFIAIVLASSMVLSPMGSPFAADMKRGVADGIEVVGAAFEAMFPQTVNVGPVPQNDMLTVGVSLPLQDPGQLNTFIQAASTPGSSQFRQFLTAAEFTSAYAPSEASYLQLESYFEGFGLHMEPSGNRLVLGVNGNPSDMGAAFHTTFADYRFPMGGTYYGPTSAPQVPASLGVAGAFGFTNALFNKPDSVTNPSRAGTSVNVPLQGCSGGGLTPSQIRSAYGVSALPSTDTGTGEKIGIVDTYDSSDSQNSLTSDIDSFDSGCGLANPTLVYNYPIQSTSYNSSGSSGWGSEEDLDMQWSHSMAPKATIEMTFSPNSGIGLYQAVDSLVAADNVNVITLSWGENDVGTYGGKACSFWCNASTDGSYAVLHPVFQAAVAEGITVFVASGDCGAADGTNTASTDYPSSDEDTTGVGGTVLSLSGGGYGSESAWSGNLSGSSCDNAGGAGGGWAPTPQPWYQHGYGVKDKGLRGVPDVGISVGTWLNIITEGGSQEEDGTSDGAPMWAGLTAIADEIHGGDIGLINPVLYSILRSGAGYNSSFHEITTGNNGYKAGPGWEPISGIGTPIANVAIPEIASGGFLVTQSGLTVTLTASTTSPAAKSPVTFTATASGGTGKYPKYTFNFGDCGGNGCNATTTRLATTTHSYSKSGAYAANVEVFDSLGNSTGSAFIEISVGTTPFTISLSANTTSTTVGAQVAFTSTPSGGTSPYTFQYYFGDGTYAPSPSSSTTYLHTYHAPGTYAAQVTATDSSNPHDGATSEVVSITVTSSKAVTLSSVAVSPTAPTVGAGNSTVFTVSPTCSSTCPAGITYTWALSNATLGSLSPTSGTQVTFTAGGTAGTVGLFVNATLGGTTKGTSTVITISSAPITLSSVAVGPTTPSISSGGTVTFTATPSCSSTCPGGITYAWSLSSNALGSLSGSSGLSVTFTAGSTAGTVGIFVNATLGGKTTTASTVITVSVPTSTLTSVTLGPTAPTVASGGTTAFTANITCSTSCPTSGVRYVWSLSSSAMGSLSGTPGPSMTFTAGSTGGTVGIFVNVTLSGTTLGSSTVITITVQTPTSVSLSPTSASIAPAGTQLFTAVPSCTATCPTSGIAYAWNLSASTLGTLDPTTGAQVTFTAGTTGGVVRIFVNATLNGVTRGSTAVITITEAPATTLTGVTISPTTTKLVAGTSQVFTAIPVCTTSGSTVSCPSGITYVWTLNNNDGNISTTTGPSTTFTAGGSGGVVSMSVAATLDGATYRYSTTIDVTASGSGGGGGGLLSGTFLWVLIILIVAVAAVVVVAILLRGKGKKDQPDIPPAWYQAQEGGAGYALPQWPNEPELSGGGYSAEPTEAFPIQDPLALLGF